MRMIRLLVRALPNVAPWRPLAVTAVVTSLVVMQAQNSGAAASRLRIGAALVAASGAFLLDDAAAVTLASVPTTLLRRRLPRVAVAFVALAVWWVAVAAASDANLGTGSPPVIVVLESAALAMIGLFVAAVAAQRSADTSGGAAGAGVAVALFAVTYLPPQSWWPLASEHRISVCLGATTAGLIAASADRARRRRLL